MPLITREEMPINFNLSIRDLHEDSCGINGVTAAHPESHNMWMWIVELDVEMRAPPISSPLRH